MSAWCLLVYTWTGICAFGIATHSCCMKNGSNECYFMWLSVSCMTELWWFLHDNRINWIRFLFYYFLSFSTWGWTTFAANHNALASSVLTNEREMQFSSAAPHRFLVSSNTHTHGIWTNTAFRIWLNSRVKINCEECIIGQAANEHEHERERERNDLFLIFFIPIFFFSVHRSFSRL